MLWDINERDVVSTHSRLKAAGWGNGRRGSRFRVSTHSRLKAAGFSTLPLMLICLSFNTQPPEGGWTGRTIVAAGA